MVRALMLVEPNKISIFWCLPQYILAVLTEIFTEIVSYQFFYTQAPVSMKAVVLTVMNICSVVGGSLVYVVESIITFEKLVNILIFINIKIIYNITIFFIYISLN